MISAAPATLCFSGTLLFLLAMLNGMAIPRLRSPRIGLSAHTTAIQSATFLIAIGLLWPRLGLTPIWSAILGHGLWISLYSLWLSLFLAGVFGAGRGMEIAGQGMTTSPIRQTLVTILGAAGSLVCLAAVIGVLIAGRWAF
jgi:hydroxylaminobenzene mutase